MNLIERKLARIKGLTEVSQEMKPNETLSNLPSVVSGFHITPYIYRGGYINPKLKPDTETNDFDITHPETEYTEANEREAIIWADGCETETANETETETKPQTFDEALEAFGLTEVRTLDDDEVLRVAKLMQRRGWTQDRIAHLTRANVAGYTVIEATNGEYLAFERFV